MKKKMMYVATVYYARKNGDWGGGWKLFLVDAPSERTARKKLKEKLSKGKRPIKSIDFYHGTSEVIS